MLHGFTGDREVLRASLDVVESVLARSPRRQHSALEALERALPAGNRAELARQIGLGGALLAVEESDLRSLFSGPGAGGFGAASFAGTGLGRFDAGSGDELGGLDAAVTMDVVGRLGAANRALSELVLRLSTVPGPRHALLFAQGWAGFSHVLMEFGTVFGPPPPAAELLRTYHQLTDDLTSAGWAIHSFDVSGVGGGSEGMHPGHEVTSTSSAGFVPFRRVGGLTGDGSDALFYVSRRTGGDFYDNHNRLLPALENMLERTGVSYRLVFQVAGEELAPRDVPYEVLLRGGPHGAQLRGAQEYRVARDDADSLRDPRQLQRRLLGGEVTRELGAVLSVMAAPAGAGLQRAVLAASLPLGQAAARTRGPAETPPSVWIQAVSLEYGAASFSIPSVYDLWTQKIDVHGMLPPPTELVVLGDVLAPCDGARLRVRLLAQDGGEELIGYDLPPCSASALEAIPLRRLDAGAVVTHEPGFEPSDSAMSPLAIGGRSFLPAPEPVVPTGDALSLLVSARGWGGGDRVEALLVDPQGRPVRTGPLEPERLELERTAVRFLSTFPVGGLSAGDYRLLLRWLDGDEVRGDAEIAIEIR